MMQKLTEQFSETGKEKHGKGNRESVGRFQSSPGFMLPELPDYAKSLLKIGTQLRKVFRRKKLDKFYEAQGRHAKKRL